MKKRIAAILCIISLILMFAGCVRQDESTIRSIDDLKGKKVGVVMGTIHDKLVSEQMPDSEMFIFNNQTDGLAALNSGRIDAFVRSLGTAIFLQYENPDLLMLDQHLTDTEVAFITAKNEHGRELNSELSEFVTGLKASGEMDRLIDKWFAAGEDGKTMPEIPSDGPNGIITMATEGTMIPYNYIRDNEIVGLEIELASMFAEQYGYGLRIETMDFSGVIPAVQTGKADFGGSCLAITPERQESVDFTEKFIAEAAVILVMAPEAEGSGSFADIVRENFEKTFIRENRYLLFWDGIKVTLEINVLSILIGTVLGFAAYIMCRKGGKIPVLVTRFCVWLIQGMPVIVLLMILYYIIFGKVDISPVLVAVISFSLVFAAGVLGLLNTGVNAVSTGQLEAAYALGFSDTRAFFKVILPQAVMHVLPAYRAQIVSLLKATAVVGYISVMDITRAGDLVRNRTYEPFFSLISVAVMYFILAGLINLVTKLIQKKVDPKRRTEKDILRGVEKR